jgi:hypothetical protein
VREVQTNQDQNLGKIQSNANLGRKATMAKTVSKEVILKPQSSGQNLIAPQA